jgi:chaperonin GroEL
LKAGSLTAAFLSPYFINTRDKQVALMEDPFNLLHDKKISSIRELLPILEQVAKAGRLLLIIADETGMTLEKASLAELGKATAYRSGQRKTPTSSTVQAKPRNIEARVKAIRGQIEEATSAAKRCINARGDIT